MSETSPFGQIALEPNDRVLVLAPHPDDETIATGGIIQKAVAMGLPVRVVFLTNGDNNEWSFVVYRKRPVARSKGIREMGLVRHDEGVAAAGLLGLKPDQLAFLGYPDFGTLKIWAEHWGDRPPFEGYLNRAVAVPYENAYRPGAPYRGDDILADVEAILREFRPTKVFVSHPADHNPDHLSFYLFARVALWNLAGEMQPALHPFLVHHPDWPELQGYHPEVAWEPPARLGESAIWSISPLTPPEIERKTAALHEHKSQYAVSTTYLESFMRANELFGDLPLVTLQPNAPELSLSHRPSADIPINSELTNAEKARFVGVERRAVWLQDGQLIVAVDFTRPFVPGVEASVYAFGYRFDRPFAEMPKLHVHIGEVRQDVQDGGAKMRGSGVAIAREYHGLTVRIPVESLGHPQYVLGSVNVTYGKVPLDWVAWRVLGMPPQP